MTEIVTELQTTLPLFVKCSNAQAEVGNNRDSLVPNSSCTSKERLQQYRFVGMLMGISALTKIYLSFNFPPFFWKKLVRFFILIYIL